MVGSVWHTVRQGGASVTSAGHEATTRGSRWRSRTTGWWHCGNFALAMKLPIWQVDAFSGRRFGGWAERLGKTTFFARQVSARGGELWCELRSAQSRVHIAGQAVLYLEGHIEL